MKKFVLSVSILMLTLSYGALNMSMAKKGGKDINLIGQWHIISQDIVDATGFKSEETYFVITEQDGDLFKGYACPQETDRTDLYGILDDKNIYVTAWDSLSFGTVNKKGTVINAISQKQSYNENFPRNESSTARIVAIKLSSIFDSCPIL